MSTNEDGYEKLEDVASEILQCGKKVQLIYAFNGTGKTRLSIEFKNLLSGIRTHRDQ